MKPGLTPSFVLKALLVAGLCLSAHPEWNLNAAEPTEPSFADWWKNPTNSGYFPIGVWLQDPKNAERYKAAGINLYVALWRGPSSNQVAALENAHMPVICSQNSFALAHKDHPIFAAWMHGDEPDNAQSLGRGKGYGPPIKPEVIINSYQRLHEADPSRPVLLNLGQGVAWNNYIGRGVRRNHPEDYPEYIKGSDIASFDIYPVVHENPEVRGKLEDVAHGVERLRAWGEGQKRVWNCIECTHIGDAQRKATPDQVRSEVWMSLIHGSQGIIYFVHEFKPAFKEAALLDDPEMLRGVMAINHEIQELAPILNGPTLTTAVRVTPETTAASIASMVKQHNGSTYLFTVSMRNESSRCTFEMEKPLQSAPGSAVIATAIGENRTIRLAQGRFTDDFIGYGVHLYRIETKN